VGSSPVTQTKARLQNVNVLFFAKNYYTKWGKLLNKKAP